MKNIEPRFIQLAEMLNDMIGEESQYSDVPKDFSMPKEVILKTADLLQKAYNKKELLEDSNGALYYAGITEDFGGLIDLEYYKQIHQKPSTMRNKDVIEIGEIEIDVRSAKSLYVRIGDWIVYIDDSTNEKIISTWER